MLANTNGQTLGVGGHHSRIRFPLWIILPKWLLTEGPRCRLPCWARAGDRFSPWVLGRNVTQAGREGLEHPGRTHTACSGPPIIMQ